MGNKIAVGCALALLLPLAACSSAKKSTDSATADRDKEIAVLHGRIQELEAQLKSTNDKLDAMRVMLEAANPQAKAPEPPEPTGIVGHPADGAGSRVEPTPSSLDPEGSFVRDQAVQSYRQAMALADARKFSEAVLGFSAFLERHPDHPLAGAAQYHIGRCYLAQKEYRVAARELERVLTSYDRSSHITQTLRDLADAKDALKLPEEAARHRQTLTSLFPQSPAASFASNNSDSSAPAIERHSPLPPEAPASSLDSPAAPSAPARNQNPGGGLDEPPAPAPVPAPPPVAPGTS